MYSQEINCKVLLEEGIILFTRSLPLSIFRSFAAEKGYQDLTDENLLEFANTIKMLEIDFSDLGRMEWALEYTFGEAWEWQT